MRQWRAGRAAAGRAMAVPRDGYNPRAAAAAHPEAMPLSVSPDPKPLPRAGEAVH
jgi:hypothetical protein